MTSHFKKQEGLLSTEDAAAVLRVSASSLHRSRSTGFLLGMDAPKPAIITSRLVQYARATLDAWAAENSALFDSDALNASQASAMLGVSYKTLEKSRKTGVLKGRPAPTHVVIDQRGHCLYDRHVLAAWLCSRHDRAVPQEAVTHAGNSFLPFMSLDGEPPPLLVSIRQRTRFRACTLRENMGIQWRYRLHEGRRMLLMAILPLPDGDAMHGHLADNSCAALSDAAEDLVLRLWRFVAANPLGAIALGTASRSVAPREPAP